MSSVSKSLFAPLLVLAAVTMLLLTARPAAAEMDAPWVGSGTGHTSTSWSDDALQPQFDYNAPGARQGSWNFKAVAAWNRTLALKWDYSGFHAYSQVKVSLERYVKRAGVEILRETLVNAGPASCCATPSGGFSYSGASTFELQQGDVYGFRLTGANSDSAPELRGSLRLTELPAPTVTPVIEGNQGPNGYYTGPTTVKWDIRDNGSPLIGTLGCADTPVTEDTTGKTFTCTATNRGGTTTQSVTVKRDATPPSVSVPGGLSMTAGRQTRTALLRYTAGATDLMDPAPTLSCTPPSGTTLGIGSWRVTCTAADATGNTTSKSFSATVYPPSL